MNIKFWILMLFFSGILLFSYGCAGDPSLTCEEQSGVLCDTSFENCPVENGLLSSDFTSEMVCCNTECVVYEGDISLTCGEQSGDLCDLDLEFCDDLDNFLAASDNDDSHICCSQECGGGGLSDDGCANLGGSFCLNNQNCDGNYVLSVDSTDSDQCCLGLCENTNLVEYIIGDGICQDGYKGDNRLEEPVDDLGENIGNSLADCRRCVTDGQCQDGGNNGLDFGEDELNCPDCVGGFGDTSIGITFSGGCSTGVTVSIDLSSCNEISANSNDLGANVQCPGDQVATSITIDNFIDLGRQASDIKILCCSLTAQCI